MRRDPWLSTMAKRNRKSAMESYNRAGHWTRTFNVRQESWGVVEHWAMEHGYHLTALKGKRRLYRKGYQQSLFLTFLDLKHDEDSITMTAWIEVGILARSVSLFTLPKVLQVEPSGLNGVFKRRAVCREINMLLDRLKQPGILGSAGIHIGDLDITTLALIVIFCLFSSLYLFGAATSIEFKPGLSHTELSLAALPLIIMGGLALLLLALHHFIAVRRFIVMRWRITSLGLCSIVFSIVSLMLIFHTSSSLHEAKVSFHCIQNYSSKDCADTLSKLSPRAKDAVLKRLQSLEKQLTIKPATGP